VAWFPETDITPPLPDTNEILIAAIKDLLHAIKKYHLTGEIIPPTLAQELQDLASLHNAPPPDLSSAPKIGTEKGWYYQKKTLCRKKGWCYLFWLSQTQFTPFQQPRNRSFHPYQQSTHRRPA
jgi:hypothetical protein